MARMSKAQKSSRAPLLPIELLAEVVRRAPEFSYLALCLTSHVFYELVAPRLYNEITIVLRGLTLKQARVKMNKTSKWRRTVLENDSKAALVRNVILHEPFARCVFSCIMLAQDVNSGINHSFSTCRVPQAEGTEWTLLIQQSLATLPNFYAFTIYHCRELNGSFDILKSLRLQPDLHTFRAGISSPRESSLFSFLTTHRNLKDVALQMESLSDLDSVPRHLELPLLERFEAPLRYW